MGMDNEPYVIIRLSGILLGLVQASLVLDIHNGLGPYPSM